MNPTTFSTTAGTYKVDNNLNVPYTFNSASNTSPSGHGYFGSDNIVPPNIACPAQNTYFSKNFPDWISTINSKMDLRGFYVTCSSSASTAHYNTVFPFFFSSNPDVLYSKSPISGQPVAFTTESIFYAQSGYFVTVVMVQWSNVFACKSRKVKIIIFLVFLNLFRI